MGTFDLARAQDRAAKQLVSVEQETTAVRSPVGRLQKQGLARVHQFSRSATTSAIQTSAIWPGRSLRGIISSGYSVMAPNPGRRCNDEAQRSMLPPCSVES